MNFNGFTAQDPIALADTLDTAHTIASRAPGRPA